MAAVCGLTELFDRLIITLTIEVSQSKFGAIRKKIVSI